MARMMQFFFTNELNAKTSGSDSYLYSNGDSGNLFLEYELDSERQGECYATIDGASYKVLTRSQKDKNQFSS